LYRVIIILLTVASLVAKLPAQIRIQVGAKICHECFDTLARNLHTAGIMFEVGVTHNNQGLALMYKQKVKRLTGIPNFVPVVGKPCNDDGRPETLPIPYLMIFDARRRDSCIVIPYRRIFDDKGRLMFNADSLRSVLQAGRRPYSSK
jgi:hypothetical protein